MEYDFMPTIGDRGQRHPRGLVGKLWRIVTPDTVHVGNCFLAGRLKPDDLFLCVGHSGDCFQEYVYVEAFANCMIGRPQWRFGSYGIGDAVAVDLNPGEFEILAAGGRVEIPYSPLETKNAARQ